MSIELRLRVSPPYGPFEPFLLHHFQIFQMLPTADAIAATIPNIMPTISNGSKLVHIPNTFVFPDLQVEFVS